MWHKTFDKRLEDWYQLRQQLQGADLETLLHNVNQWWYQTPWTAYHLHWDEVDLWPGPWDLLNKNIYCDLARALGIVYTVMLVSHHDVHDCEILEAGGTNLVLVNKEKYILNWNPGQIVNILPETNITHRISSSEIQNKLG